VDVKLNAGEWRLRRVEDEEKLERHQLYESKRLAKAMLSYLRRNHDLVSRQRLAPCHCTSNYAEHADCCKCQHMSSDSALCDGANCHACASFICCSCLVTSDQVHNWVKLYTLKP
jgi:hypothetical protein